MIVKPLTSNPWIDRLEAIRNDHPNLSQHVDTAIAKRKAGERAEKDAAYFLDFAFGAGKNFALIHNLRLEHGNFSAQIDHIAINRLMTVFVIETKSFASGIKIGESGEYLRWNSYHKRYEAIESPLAQAHRHCMLLERILSETDIVPRKLGIRLSPNVVPIVLVSPKSRITRPEKYDTSNVLKADDFVMAVQADKFARSEIGSLANVIGVEKLTKFATDLAAFDRPIEISDEALLGRPVPFKTAARSLKVARSCPNL